MTADREWCPLCPHLLEDHEDGLPCSVVVLDDQSDTPADFGLWTTFTSRCKFRDRKEQPYPWRVAVPVARVIAAQVLAIDTILPTRKPVRS